MAGSGPGLSDLAVSPFGLPLALLRDEVPVAFVGRTSTEDSQDPRQSLMRQLERCKTALPGSWVIVAHFFDVESGRMDLEHRGRKSDYERFGIPIARDGGITDLLREAAQPARRFEVVICESTSRVARRMYETLSVERELEYVGVPLFAWNEPIKLDGGRAQQVLQRRINQSVAEYEVLNTLEQSWGGTCAHVREGWNIGKPAYGYKAKKYRHPNPAKAAHGATKTRLEPDGKKAETVTRIAAWRYHEQLGYAAIVERLNADLDAYPPPEPPGGRRARGAWSKTSVADILRNPKYTGYQVYNRRASRSRHGQVNDPRLWVWSAQPVHEPLIPKWMFDALAATSTARMGSRAGHGVSRHPAARRTYLLRGMVFCGCGRRMFGGPRGKNVYYLCWPRANNRGRPDKHTGHPATVYLREHHLLAVIGDFYAQRVFGPDRRDLLAADLATIDDRQARARDTARDRHQRALAELERRQQNLLRQAQDAGPDDPFGAALRANYNQLDTQRHEILTALADLDQRKDDQPRPAVTGDTGLLDALPYLAVNLTTAPEPLQRRLFEITRLTIHAHPDQQEATITITLPANHLADVTTAASAITTPDKTTANIAGRTVDVKRAPGETRTHTGRVLNPLPLPIGLRGLGRTACLRGTA